MTCVTGVVEGDMPSIGGCLTLHCPSYLISLVDTSFHALLCSPYRNVNIEIERNKASTKVATEFPYSREAFQDVISSVLRRVYAGPRHTVKLLSAAVDIDIKTARSYLEGQRTPSGYALFQLMAKCRELRDEINRHAAELEATYKAAEQTNNKTDKSVRRDNAEFGIRTHATARVGCRQAWRHESVAIWPSFDLVDGWPGLGGVRSEPQDPAIGKCCAAPSGDDGKPHEGP